MIDRVHDACRFILYSQRGIIDWPLQVYAAALIFSPEKSITRLQYKSEEPRWITNKPKVEYHWSPCLQTMEHGDEVHSVCFSHDAKLVASSSICVVKIWNAQSGKCLTTFSKNNGNIESISFSRNSKLLALISTDSAVEVWDITDDKRIAKLNRLSEKISCATFFQQTDFIACGSVDGKVGIWDSSNGARVRKLEGHSSRIEGFAFSSHLGCLASGSHSGNIKIWNTKSGKCLHVIPAHLKMIEALTFSPDSKLLASCSLNSKNPIKLFKTGDWSCSMTLSGHKSSVRSLKFSHDSKLLASGSRDNTIKLWDTDSGACLQTLHSHQSFPESVVFSHDSQILASGSNDYTIRIWDAKSRQKTRRLDSHGCQSLLYFSKDSSRLASVADDEAGSIRGIKIWDARNGQCIQSLEGSKSPTHVLAFSKNLKLLAEGSGDNRVRIWDIRSAKCMQKFTGSHKSKEYFLKDPGLKLFDGTLCSSSFSSRGPDWLSHCAYLRHGTYGISGDKRCITRNSECLLWLPSEYGVAPIGRSVQKKSTICIGCSSGQVLLFTVMHRKNQS